MTCLSSRFSRYAPCSMTTSLVRMPRHGEGYVRSQVCRRGANLPFETSGIEGWLQLWPSLLGAPSFSVSSSRPKRQIRVTTERAVIASPRSEAHRPSSDRGIRRWAIGLTSLIFIVLQSVCTLLMALSGFRLIIGLGALAAVVTGANAPATGFHQDAIRLPMMVLAVIGSGANLYLIWRLRSLRNRPSAQWRQQSIRRRRLWGERVQITLAVVTLFLVLAEFLAHHFIFRLVG